MYVNTFGRRNILVGLCERGHNCSNLIELRLSYWSSLSRCSGKTIRQAAELFRSDVEPLCLTAVTHNFQLNLSAVFHKNGTDCEHLILDVFLHFISSRLV